MFKVRVNGYEITKDGKPFFLHEGIVWEGLNKDEMRAIEGLLLQLTEKFFALGGKKDG